MGQIILKRIAFFTNIYLILAAISVVIWINKKDSFESTQELKQLITLQDIVSIDPIKLTPVINQKAASWINQNDTTIKEDLLKLSEQFTFTLNANGIYADKDQLDPEYKCNPTLFPLAYVGSINHDSTVSASPYTLNQTIPSEALIRILVEKTKYAGSPTTIHYIKSFDKAALHSSIDSLVFSNIMIPKGKKLSKHDSLLLKTEFFADKDINYFFTDTSIFFLFGTKTGKTGVEYWSKNLWSIQVPAVSGISIETPSILALLEKPNLTILGFLSGYDEINTLKEKYGDLLISEAIKYLSEDSIKAYRSISLFGFEFSKRRLPWVLAFFCFVAAIGISTMVDTSRKKNLKIFSELNGDQIANMFIEETWLRFMVWCILPVWVMLLALPKISLPSIDNIDFYATLAVVTYLNVRAFIVSLKG